MYRKREYKDSNYKAVFFNGKTVRMRIDNNKPITSIPTPELEDVAINSKCFANCFPPETLIKVKEGFKLISEIKEGDIVISYNEKGDFFEEKIVYELFKRKYNKEIIKIILDNDKKILCTPNHKLLTKKRGWVMAGELTEKDELIEFN